MPVILDQAVERISDLQPPLDHGDRTRPRVPFPAPSPETRVCHPPAPDTPTGLTRQSPARARVRPTPLPARRGLRPPPDPPPRSDFSSSRPSAPLACLQCTPSTLSNALTSPATAPPRRLPATQWTRTHAYMPFPESPPHPHLRIPQRPPDQWPRPLQKTPPGHGPRHQRARPFQFHLFSLSDFQLLPFNPSSCRTIRLSIR